MPKARWRPGHVGHMIEINGLGERGAQKRGADVSESLMDWRRSGVLSWSSGAGWLTEDRKTCYNTGPSPWTVNLRDGEEVVCFLLLNFCL